jgi:hypothetical protein
VDPNFGGKATSLHLSGLRWGRMVDVFDLDPSGEKRLQHADYVVGADIITDAINVVVETSPVSRRESVIIQYTLGHSQGNYERTFASLDQNLAPVIDQGSGGGALFTMVPRNAVLVLILDDLLDPETVHLDSVLLRVGAPPTTPFEARVMLDYNHGDLVSGSGGPTFRSTRVIIDPTVSELESFMTDPPMPVNGVGFPRAVDVNQTNLAVRLPSEEFSSIGTDVILRNLSGHSLARSQNGSIDFSSWCVSLPGA